MWVCVVCREHIPLLHTHSNFTSVAILPVASTRLPVSYMMDLCSKQICSYRAKDFVLQKSVYKITHQFKCIYSNIHQIGVFFKPGKLNRVKVLLREEWTRVFSTPHIPSAQSVMWVNLPWIFSPQFYQFQKLSVTGAVLERRKQGHVGLAANIMPFVALSSPAQDGSQVWDLFQWRVGCNHLPMSGSPPGSVCFHKCR